jgi:class 3 adenylate cyclase/tetratricopeptide (TPR) repeat protein
VSENLSIEGGTLLGKGTATSSAWGSFVPDFVVQTLLDHPDRPPIANTAPIDAVVLFADIVGFTPMSEALARAGSYGTEELTRILNSWFGSMAHCIANHGGTVAEFAGDALIAVFRYGRRTRRATMRRAVQCALDMQAAMTSFRAVVTRAGTFGLAMKAGLGDGRLLLTIMGDPAIRLQYVLAGQALDRAAAAERHAGSGEAVVDSEVIDSTVGIEVRERRARWCVVAGLRRRVPPQVRPPSPQRIDEGAAGRLLPFLHPAITQRLRSGRRDLVNEHRKVSVAFVGLLELVADDPRAVADLQSCVAAAVQVIARYDGYLHQIATGDKGTLLIAYFGAPVSHEDDEERAVRCCLQLLRLPGGALCAGVTTGFVYCGEAGSQSRRTYTVIGDSVNLAARLMWAARPGQLLIDGTTHARVRETTTEDRLEPVTVKGRAGHVDVWSVRAVRERILIPSHTAASTEPLVARHLEVTKVQALAQRVRAGEGQVFCLTGEAGIGKSRLVAEAIKIAESLGFMVYGGACRSLGTTTSYLVWRSIWRGLLDLDTSRPLAEQQAQLTAQVARRERGSGGRAPLLGPVLNLPMPDSELTAALDPQTRDELSRSLLLDCLRERAARPLLLVLEDCHWIDPASQALLKFLARNIGDQRVLIAVTARPATAPSPLASLSQLEWFSEIQLAELAAADAERLVVQRLRRWYGEDATLAPDLVRQLADRGGGNPLYLEELVSFLHAQGVDPHDGRTPATLDLPASLQRLMMARIDQLAEGEQATIKVASVIGRRFRPQWISGSYPAAGSPEEVARHLEHLAELDLTPRHSTDPELEYQFRHAVTQEAAYGSLTFSMRETLHERVGQFIERTYPDRLAQYVDVLAHHYGCTRRADKQRVWFRAAGDAAKAAFANQAAIDYYERLLPLLPELETGEVLAALGAVLQLTGGWEEAEATYRRAMEVARRSGDRGLLAASQRDLGNLFMYRRSHAKAVTWLTRAADEFNRLGDRHGLSIALDRLTYAFIRQSAYTEALATAERHLDLATEAADPAGMSIALNHMGLVRSNIGDTRSALALLERALDMATRAGDQGYLIHAVNNLAFVHFTYGDQRRAAMYWQEALSVAQRIGYRQTAALAIGNLGEVYREQGDHARANKCFFHSLRIAAELGDWRGVAYKVASVAVTAAAQGHGREAEWLFSRAIDLARVLDSPYLLCYSLHHQAQLYAARGWLDKAERLNGEALEIANQRSERDIQVRAELLSIRLQLALGRIDEHAAIRRLRVLRDAWTEPHERAVLLDLLFQLDPVPETRREAAGLYRSLCERAPSVEYREAYARLTGMTLPPGPPLPPLPEAVKEEVVEIDELLRQVDLAARQLNTDIA